MSHNRYYPPFLHPPVKSVNPVDPELPPNTELEEHHQRLDGFSVAVPNTALTSSIYSPETLLPEEGVRPLEPSRKRSDPSVYGMGNVR